VGTCSTRRRPRQQDFISLIPIISEFYIWIVDPRNDVECWNSPKALTYAPLNAECEKVANGYSETKGVHDFKKFPPLAVMGPATIKDSRNKLRASNEN
jgi:hypothetical protein